MLEWFARPKPTIEFFCAPEDFGAIEKPVPASKVMPVWYRDLPPIDPEVASTEDPGLTVKRCMPFLEALSLGWIVPMPCDLRVKLSDEGATISTHNDYPKRLVSPHLAHQVRGSPMERKAIVKVSTLWNIRTSPGWSCLFTQPLNRPSDFQVVSGVVDTDLYHQLVIPLHFTRADGLFTLEKGTPLVQVIPFERDRPKAVVKAASKADWDATFIQERAVFSEKAWYRKHIWSRR